ncbi:MAG: hypothetical protein WC788_06935 [Candidatus Paceibacterota bacterium]|jgi:adenylate cyclase
MTNKSTLKIEEERKFLVKPRLLPPNFIENTHFQIVQYYFTKPGDSVEIRIRSQVSKTDAKYFLTMKKKTEDGDISKRFENEIEIPNEMFYRMLYGADYERISKERFLVELEVGVVVEVDVYDYDPKASLLSKNIVAEIERKNGDQIIDLKLPLWIGEEVTGRPEYSNAVIAVNGFPKKK